jgi:cell division cycle 14
MHRAVVAGHFRLESFSVDEYERLSRLEHGDVSWIVPGKFIAFSGPLSNRRELSPGVFTMLPQEYVNLFQRLGVTCVIRFNNKCYDRKVFTRAGIRHVDLFYEDGGNPTDAILQVGHPFDTTLFPHRCIIASNFGIFQSFLQICEQETGAIAVHCKAGLGRTGTNIAAYLIKHYGYSARESIAWCRICRPGSVVGPQQQYLISMESRLRAAAPPAPASAAIARGRDSGGTYEKRMMTATTASSDYRSSKGECLV